MKCIKVNRQGMTLIELLLALSLSSMLIVVLFSLLLNLSRSQNQLKRSHPYRPWMQRLESQLQADYQGCQRIQITPKRIQIDGYSSQLDSEGRQRMAPSSIRYTLLSDATGNWLYRNESNLLDGRKKREFVCKGVIGFRDFDGLATDVAPGVARLELVVKSDAPDDSTDKGSTESETLLVCLCRHGGS